MRTHWLFGSIKLEIKLNLRCTNSTEENCTRIQRHPPTSWPWPLQQVHWKCPCYRFYDLDFPREPMKESSSTFSHMKKLRGRSWFFIESFELRVTKWKRVKSRFIESKRNFPHWQHRATLQNPLWLSCISAHFVASQKQSWKRKKRAKQRVSQLLHVNDL